MRRLGLCFVAVSRAFGLTDFVKTVFQRQFAEAVNGRRQQQGNTGLQVAEGESEGLLLLQIRALDSGRVFGTPMRVIG